MIFPGLKNQKFGYTNLNLEAKEWLKNYDTDDNSNPLLNPAICQKMVDSVHKKYGTDFSYGGWMENRSILWKGSYLEQARNFIHLGIDVNVPAGTEVAAGFNAVVVKIDDDRSKDGGWGPRVILKHATEPIYMIHAHLDRDIKCKVGDTLKISQVFAKVGKAPLNGNWFPHLHLQTISKKYYEKLEKSNSWAQLDGYGLTKDIEKNSKLHPDPLQYVSLI